MRDRVNSARGADERHGECAAGAGLEAEVLAALWAADAPLTAGEVVDALGGGLAYNTVQTILTRRSRSSGSSL